MPELQKPELHAQCLRTYGSVEQQRADHRRSRSRHRGYAELRECRQRHQLCVRLRRGRRLARYRRLPVDAERAGRERRSPAGTREPGAPVRGQLQRGRLGGAGDGHVRSHDSAQLQLPSELRERVQQYRLRVLCKPGSREPGSRVRFAGVRLAGQERSGRARDRSRRVHPPERIVRVRERRKRAAHVLGRRGRCARDWFHPLPRDPGHLRGRGRVPLHGRGRGRAAEPSRACRAANRLSLPLVQHVRVGQLRQRLPQCRQRVLEPRPGRRLPAVRVRLPRLLQRRVRRALAGLFDTQRPLGERVLREHPSRGGDHAQADHARTAGGSQRPRILPAGPKYTPLPPRPEVPQTAPECTTDLDCPGDYVCEEARCLPPL